MTQPTAALLVLGDEILSGRTQDANAPHLARVLAEIGIRLVEIRVIPDAPDTITQAVRDLAPRVAHLFTSGGIGPTHDDITADCVAMAMGAAIGVRADAREILERYYGDDLNEARLRMARIPDGATLIDNPLSHAPGFTLANVHVMAGVPAIFREMLAGLVPRLEGGAPMVTHSFRVNRPEGDIADALRLLAADHPEVAIGCYPFYKGGFGCTLILRGEAPAAVAAAADDLRRMLARVTDAVEETAPAASPRNSA